MQAPGITYQFTSGKDVAGPSFEILSRQEQLSASNNQITLLFTGLPKDRVLVLTNATLNWNPGAGQVAVESKIQAATQGGFLVDITSESEVQAADAEGSLNWSGVFYVMGQGVGETALRAFTLFNANANANFFDWSFHGIVIPRGNAGAF